MTDFARIEFRTLDRTLLRGNFFRADVDDAPAVVTAHLATYFGDAFERSGQIQLSFLERRL